MLLKAGKAQNDNCDHYFCVKINIIIWTSTVSDFHGWHIPGLMIILHAYCSYVQKLTHKQTSQVMLRGLSGLWYDYTSCGSSSPTDSPGLGDLRDKLRVASAALLLIENKSLHY